MSLRLGIFLALTGLALVIAPLAAHVLIPNVALLVLSTWWVVAWTGGCLAALTGVRLLGRSGSQSSVRASRNPGLRFAVIATILLAIGLLSLLGVLWFVGGCHAPCGNGGGPSAGSGAASASCGQVCEIGVGNLVIWPIQILLGSFIADTAGVVALAVGAGTAIRSSWADPRRRIGRA